MDGPSALPINRSVAQVLSAVFNRPNLATVKVLRVTDIASQELDELGRPTLMASVLGPMDLPTMFRLLEEEATQGAAVAENRLAFIDGRVPDRMLYSPVVSRQLVRPLAWHLATADAGSYPFWTLPDIINLVAPEDLAEAEAFARAHYGPAPPPGSPDTRPVRRQRRGCRGGKGRKRHQTADNSFNFSPRIMSGANSLAPLIAPNSWPGASSLRYSYPVPPSGPVHPYL